MVTIEFLKRPSIEVESGATLMQALLDHEIPVASSCGGDGVCRKCVLKIVKGGENLAPPNELEQHLIERDQLSSRERISCQAVILGPVTLDAPYW
jgi:2Fe-2S ferredoxin